MQRNRTSELLGSEFGSTSFKLGMPCTNASNTGLNTTRSSLEMDDAYWMHGREGVESERLSEHGRDPPICFGGVRVPSRVRQRHIARDLGKGVRHCPQRVHDQRLDVHLEEGKRRRRRGVIGARYTVTDQTNARNQQTHRIHMCHCVCEKGEVTCARFNAIQGQDPRPRAIAAAAAAAAEAELYAAKGCVREKEREVTSEIRFRELVLSREGNDNYKRQPSP
jgi:hypothetical protein